MTKQEFLKAYAEARRIYNSINLSTIKKMHEAYIEASNQVVEVIRKAEKAGLSDLTIASWTNLNTQLIKSAQHIQDEITKNIIDGMHKSVGLGSEINEAYLIDIIENIEDSPITAAGISNVFINFNDLIIRSVLNRVFTNGYNFATSVWSAGQYYQDQIKKIVSIGLAQNRDLLEIARDIQIYTRDGKVALAKRYGELLRPAKEFMKRIGNKIDWRAIRLARSELYQAIQEAAREHGRVNPGCIDLYDWILTANRTKWNCACEDIQRNSPYKYKEVPAYPHPNCRCYVRPVLMDRKKFEDQLIQWVNGAENEYLQRWYYDIYIPNFAFPDAA